ncbi:hypothetical protein E4O03_04655 [Treponema sp. OMZ 792]|uniref:hypothetical protein n=1 Tax=unclassified Treponema TaxID=2638727 RepID=UPI0020A2A775|nr:MULTISPECIES: hypothetical protein [unclassified Treponema]UTC76003.1 hypothetical protein E4O03_04655 [Treponema sp. OMZ 792]UTC80005.1 hypothetical protein E4O07_04675 [Treponema sp. OMZ 798]
MDNGGKKIKLIVSGIHFYSQLDEEAFDFCLNNISNKFIKIDSKIIIHIERKSLNIEKLRNIFGLKARYNITIENIDELVYEKNKDFILNPNSYWYKYFNKKQ